MNPFVKPILEPDSVARLRIIKALLPLLPPAEHPVMIAHVQAALGMHGETATARAVRHVANGLRLYDCLDLARDIRDYPGPDDCPHRNKMVHELADKLSAAMDDYL